MRQLQRKIDFESLCVIYFMQHFNVDFIIISVQSNPNKLMQFIIQTKIELSHLQFFCTIYLQFIGDSNYPIRIPYIDVTSNLKCN